MLTDDDFFAFLRFLAERIGHTLRPDEVARLWDKLTQALPSSVIKRAVHGESRFAEDLVKQAIAAIGRAAALAKTQPALRDASRKESAS